MSETNTRKWRKVTLTLYEPNGTDMETIIADLETYLDSDDVIPAIKATARDFLRTEAGREAWEQSCRHFDYGDFLTNVTNEFCEPRGFRLLDEDAEVITDGYNTQLASLDDDETSPVPEDELDGHCDGDEL